MSYSIDVNILLYASDQSNRWQRRAREFVAECASKSEVLCLTWPTVMSYLRMATHPRIFDTPLSPTEAERNAQALLDLPQTRMLSEDDEFWVTYLKVTSGLPVRGNHVPDAHLAALLLRYGVKTLYTKDRDFRKFDFIDARDPLDP